MKIVVLDGYTLNPGDLSWEPLEALSGDITYYDRTPGDKIPERAEQAEILLTNKTPLTREVIESLPDLKYIGVLATGYNVVDCEAAADRNIPVTNIPSYGTDAVAQMVFAHIFNFARRIDHHAKSVREGGWAKSMDFCYWEYPQIELTGQVLGLVGLGKIGLATARIGLAFGMKVIAYKPTPPDNPIEGIRMTDLDSIFRESDFLSLHCPLTEDNKHMVNSRRLALMKPGAFFINTSRGPLVDESALYRVLEKNEIGGAGLDVMENEPPPENHPLYRLENCHITPHIAWATRAARNRLLHTAVDNLQRFLHGEIQNCVNGVDSVD